MINLNTYVDEAMHFKLTRNYKKPYNYFPKDKNELEELVYKLIEKRGENADLNDIDTSKITDMSMLFMFSRAKFNGDISKWDVSNVESMRNMFNASQFDGDLSKWDVSNVEDMSYMFHNSNFTGKNGDISKWDVRNVEKMNRMFFKSKFTGKNGDISKWDVSNVKDMQYMFNRCPLQNNPPKWYKK